MLRIAARLLVLIVLVALASGPLPAQELLEGSVEGLGLELRSLPQRRACLWVTSKSGVDTLEKLRLGVVTQARFPYRVPLLRTATSALWKARLQCEYFQEQMHPRWDNG